MPLLLSLCIPTFNRAALLEETLSSVLTQIELARRDQIEIVVSDNASADETAAVVARFQAANPNLHWNCFRHVENKGADTNILQAVTLARGEFVYLVSDDDVLLPGALEKIFGLMHSFPALDAFCLNSRSFLTDPAVPSVPEFTVTADCVVTCRDDCLRFAETRITFISLLAFRRSGIDLADYRQYIGTSLLQSYLYVDVLASGRGMAVTREAYLATRDNNTGGYNFFEVFITQFGALMRHAQKQGYSAQVVREVRLRHLARFLLPFVIAFKRHGAYGRLQPDFRDGLRRSLKEYGLHPVLVFGVLPLLLLPPGAVRSLSALVRRLRGAARSK